MLNKITQVCAAARAPGSEGDGLPALLHYSTADGKEDCRST